MRLKLYIQRTTKHLTALFLAAAIASSAAFSVTAVPVKAAATLRVPQDYPTIQKAVDAAQSGDIVLVSPGTYNEEVRITGKAIVLTSEYPTTGDPATINGTIINGSKGDVVRVDANAAGTEIHGFTIQNGSDGISAKGQAGIFNNRIIQNGDGIDATDANLTIRSNIFENNLDDGVDFDKGSSGVVEYNTIQNNNDDGIEMRMQNYSGEPLNIVIRGNTITGNLEDGIQLIDYSGLSPRTYLIEHNLIAGNAMAGLGLMDNANSREDFRGAQIPERIMVYNNTFVNNPYGLTGGGNLIALNNIFLGSTEIGMKNTGGSSTAAYNLFWGNGANHEGSNVDESTTKYVDPLLDATNRLSPGSPAIDTGIASFVWNGETVLSYPPESYIGAAPDLGWSEFGSQASLDNSHTPEAKLASVLRPKQSFILLPPILFLGNQEMSLQ